MRIVRPSTESELAEWLSEQYGGGELLVTGHEPDWRRSGVSPLPSTALSTSALSDVIELRPSDLTIEVGAGLRVAKLSQVVQAEGLWLPFADGMPDRSIGGLVADAPPTPFDGAFGPIRRHVLACTLAHYDGRLTRWGRAVMKNVAGYDVPRLMCGSRGRLGVLTSITLRLWPRPRSIRRFAVRGHESKWIESSAPPRTEGLVTSWTSGRDEIEARVVVAGGPDSSRRRTEGLERWAEEQGLTLEEMDEPEGEDGARWAERPVRAVTGAVYRVTFGRSYVADGREAIRRWLGAAPGPRRMQTFPASGVVGIALDGLEAATHRRAQAWLATITEPVSGRRKNRVGTVPALRIERGGPAEHEVARRLRPAARRHLEARLLNAFGGRETAWQADYL